MKDRGRWRLWSLFLLLSTGNLFNLFVECQYNEGGVRGDEGSPASLGFSGVELRHDGYVKGETPTIPQTSFSCSAQQYNPGLYADIETQCQVYHVCFEDRQESFLCGPGTNFNQRILACDFWYNFDCQESPTFYSVNSDIGKVPESALRAGQGRVPPQQPSFPSIPQQPPSRGSYPNPVSVPPPPPKVQPKPQPENPSYPGFPQQPPSEGSYPTRGSLPPPPPRVQPQPPKFQPQPPQIEPQPPRFQPQPPQIEPQPPRFQPQPPQIDLQPPRFQPQPPQLEPQPPRFQPEPPQPQPPRFQPQPPQPQPPRFQPQPPQQQPPRFQPPQPQPPRFQPPQPQPPRFQPQPPSIPAQPPFPEFRPPPPQVSQNEYPRVPQSSGQPPKVRQPPVQQLTPSIQREDESSYQFGADYPSKPISIPPPQPAPRQTPRPVFPPVVSPPRVSRPPLTPPVIRQPEIAISRPRVPIASGRPEFHPDSNLKGNVDYRPPQQPRIPQPSRPVGTGYPSYPVSQVHVVQKPAEKPSRRPSYQPPPTVQQEHVDTEYVPPPPPQPPKEPSKPKTTYVPPPPVQQEIAHVAPPQPPSRPAYVPPPVSQEPADVNFGKKPVVAQKPVDTGYGKQPPVSPSIIREQQKPAIVPPSRPQVSVGVRQPQPPQRPKPVFPPASDHPNANIKGGPGYQQPPPQIPRFEPTRISRPSTPQGGYQPPPKPSVDQGATISVKPTGDRSQAASGSGGYKPPQQGRIKKPSEPPKSVYQPPIQVIDHPRSEIKGYEQPIPQQPQRIQSPSTSVSGVKRPQSSGGYQQPQVQRPRAPIVVSRPQPPSLPTTSIKRTSPVEIYEQPKPQPPAPSRVKLPSQTQGVLSQPRFPSHQQVDHPNANIKGGGGYNQVRQQPHAGRPSSPPSAPSTSYEQKTSSPNQGQGFGGGYPQRPRGDEGYNQQPIIHQQEFKPQRTQKTAVPSSVKTTQVISGVKDASAYKKPPSVSAHSSIVPKQMRPEYESGSSYTRGPDTYPKPEFGQPNGPYQPESIPSRSQTTKQKPAPQNSIAQNKPTYQGLPASTGSGTAVRPDYPYRQVPGHQPPHQRQVFPHRENPDHPNESLKGSGAYRPPPPAGYQAAASEVQEQKVPSEAKPDTSSPLLGDVGAE